MQNAENQPFTKRVLVIGRYELQLASVLNYLYESGFDAIGALRDDEAFHLFEEHNPHIVIFTNQVEKTSKDIFIKKFIKENVKLMILELSGGISALKLLLENL